MNRRDFLRRSRVAAVGTALYGACMHAGLGDENGDQGHARPNIIWIYSDDHAEQAISAYGSHLSEVAPTPHIDRMASEGMLFRNSFVTNSICGPARAVILTGLHSHLNGFLRNGNRFDGTQQTFPKLLRDVGYETALFGKWHLGGTPTGFDTWEILPGQGHYYNPDFITPRGRRREQGYVTDVITSKSLDWLRERESDKPFMLMVQHKAPHRAWEPGPDHLHLFRDVDIPEPETLFDDYEGRGTAARKQEMTIANHMELGYDLKVWRERDTGTGRWNQSYGRMNEEQRAAWDAAYGPENEAFLEANLRGEDRVRWKYQRYIKDYLRCITSIDDNVGRILDYLDESGLARNTVVIYSSDQGFYLGEHGWYDKRFIYEESLRTPMIVRWPGVARPGSEEQRMIQNLDVAPTLLEMAGAPVPGNMQGHSLVPLMRGESPEQWRTSVYYHYYEGEGSWHNVHKHYGVRNERYKLVYFYTLDEWEFYDLKKDPMELNSRYADPDYAEQVEQLKTELARLRRHYRVPDEG